MKTSRQRLGGWSLLEVLFTVLLISIVATLVVVTTNQLRRKAKKAVCMSHMRTLHTAFSAYMLEHGHWPQMDEDENVKWTESRFFEFWIKSLEPYGPGQETWLCPSDQIYGERTDSKRTEYFGSYVPTPFDDAPGTPLRWNQPWLLERGDFHGQGSHMLMPDGSVQSTQNPFSGR